MTKMGYIHGQGLGKEGEGRVAPVEVFVLPEGHISLDRVMELKEKKLLKKKKLELGKTAKSDSTTTKEDNTDVFDFINQTLLKKSTFYYNNLKLNFF